ncbi:hypothetical protein ElyMa_002715200 [Elysia marginata]|uniref:Rna-directed dna polymerase from mobile element jockey-like n=1 Tax=Elysia marginata TaxID=1093978 RepID=A0AAV4HHK6_9GAST|nr:hypothetical protein ElyMa_002715200 [Elysia marginata]
MKRGPITCEEIEKAMRDSKSNRAPRKDNITTDMLKTDSEMSAKCLVKLFNKVWTGEKVPETWKKVSLRIADCSWPARGSSWRCCSCLRLVSCPANSTPLDYSKSRGADLLGRPVMT